LASINVVGLHLRKEMVLTRSRITHRFGKFSLAVLAGKLLFAMLSLEDFAETVVDERKEMVLMRSRITHRFGKFSVAILAGKLLFAMLSLEDFAATLVDGSHRHLRKEMVLTRSS
jgi:hypothetical protein